MRKGRGEGRKKLEGDTSPFSLSAVLRLSFFDFLDFFIPLKASPTSFGRWLRKSS